MAQFVYFAALLVSLETTTSPQQQNTGDTKDLCLSLRGVTLLITSGTLKISSTFHYRALIITETALATMAPHYGTVYHAI